MRLKGFSFTHLDMQEPSPSEEDGDCSSTMADEIPSIHLQEKKRTIFFYKEKFSTSISPKRTDKLESVRSVFLIPGSDFSAVTHAKAGLDTMPS